jgi:hypothetical protein
MSRGKFLSEHDQKNSHLCRIKGTQHVPVILSLALPRPDRGKEEHEQWCRSMLLIFKPWRVPGDLRGGHASWRAAFENNQFSNLANTIMQNMNVEHECQDAKKASNNRKQSGTSIVVDQMAFDGESSDMDSLSVVLQNDPNLHDEVDDDTDYEAREGLQSASKPSQVSELDKVIGDAERNGVFAKKCQPNGTENSPKGMASELQHGDEEMISMHSSLMKELKKLKRPSVPSEHSEETDETDV